MYCHKLMSCCTDFFKLLYSMKCREKNIARTPTGKSVSFPLPVKKSALLHHIM